MKTLTLLLFCCVSTACVMAQGLTRVSMDKGQRFIVAFAPLAASPSEKPHPKPLEIVTTSEFEANVRIRSMDPTLAKPIDTVLHIVPKANSAAVASWSTPYLMLVSTTKRRAKVALEVTSDVPVTVTAQRNWDGCGERTHTFPVSHWGTNYRVFSRPTDVYGMPGKYKWVPGFVAVIGSEDGTQVTLTSKLKLIDPNNATELQANVPNTFTLDAGEVMMFDHAIDTSKVHTAAQDLTGTLVVSDKPIGVLSGHLKGSVMTRYRVLPPTGMWSADAHFVRNALAEMVPPTSMADTLHVMIPFKYTDLRVGWKHHDSADCMILGDVARFIAVQNNTHVFKQRQGQKGWTLLGFIQSGEVLTDSSLFEPAVYTSSYPVLAAQYGRSYARVAMFDVDKVGADNSQGHPTVEAGLPTMAMIAPESRWVTSASWTSVQGRTDNFCSIVFRTGDEGSIRWNGRPLTEIGGVVELAETPFSQLTSIVTADVNLVQSGDDDVRFNVLPQCSEDGLQQSIAMAAPTGYDNAAPGMDTIVITEDMVAIDDTSCGARDVSVSINGPNGIATIFAAQRSNYQLVLNGFTQGDKEATFRVEPIDPTMSAQITVRIVAASGASADRSYVYTPTPAEVTATSWPVRIGVGVDHCFDVEIKNPDATDLVVHDIALKIGGELTHSLSMPLTIAPGASQMVQCCYAPSVIGPVNDSLIMSHTCFDRTIMSTTTAVVSPSIGVEDALFGTVEVTTDPITKTVQIENRDSSVRMQVIDLRWSSSSSNDHFQFDKSSLGLPLILDPGAKVSIDVTYDPRGDAGLHQAAIRVLSTSTGSDSLIRCSAEAKVISSVEESEYSSTLYPIPVMIGGVLTAHLPQLGSARVVDARGLIIEEINIDESGMLQIMVTLERYTQGVYLLVVTNASTVNVYRWMVE